MKRCSRCKRRKRAASFHRDAGPKDGRSRRCKACASEQTAAWAARNRKRKNATDREWKRRNRHKDRARGAVRTALRTGVLIRPWYCECCRRRCVPYAHHLDYARPLEVKWLCNPCHAAHHEWGRKRPTCEAHTIPVAEGYEARGPFHSDPRVDALLFAMAGH